MEAISNRSINIARQTTARIFLGTLLFLSFFVYPLGIFPVILKIGQSVFFNLPHYITFPGVATLSLLAVPVLLFFNWRLNRVLLLAVIVFFFMLLLNIPRELEYLDDFLILAGYVVIPLAAAILLKSGYLSLHKVAVWACSLWLLQILLGSIALYRRMEPVGSPGNINWMAGLLLMLSPWVIWFFIQWAEPRIKNRLVAIAGAILVWLVPTASILYHCHSRSAWLAICLLPLIFIVIRLRRAIHKILFSTMLVLTGISLLAATYIWFPTSLLRVVEADIRVPVWTGTGVMMVKHPLGIGSGKYQKHFTPLRRVSSYQHRLYAADMTVHPHNEALNIGSQLGIPALLAFLIMISTIGRSVSNDPLQICARISGYFVVMSSMFDMFLVQPPTNFLGLFVLGLCWPMQVHPDHAEEKATPLLFISKTVLSGLAIACMAIICYLDITHDIAMRSGMIEEKISESYMKLNRHDESRKSLEQAIALYKKSIMPFNSVIPLYKIGRLSLNLPGQTDQAETYLKRVAAIDPNFSHLNLLLGQLSLQQHNLVAAERFYTRECSFFPRSDRAWQKMYVFTTATSRYDRSIAIDALLGDIYREKALQNFGENELAEKRKSLAKALQAANFTEAQNVARGFFDRINHNFTDPLFLQITLGQTWPTFFFSGGFNALDVSTWHLRYTILKSLQKELGPLPLPPQDIVSWYSRTIQIQDTGSFTLPLGVWNHRAGSLLSVYLLFSMVCELNQTPSIIYLNSEGQPDYAYLFVKDAAHITPSAKDRTESKKTTLAIKIFKVNLRTPSCKLINHGVFKKNFRWIPGQTFAFYPMADFFLRNQILGILTNEDQPYLPQQPPSIKLLELFTLTGNPPPPLPTLKNFCFGEHIRYQYNMIRKKPSNP